MPASFIPGPGVARRALAAAAAILSLALPAGCGSGGSEPAGSPTDGGEPSEGPFATVSYAPWPGALHDPGHSSSSPAAGPTTGKLAWKRKLEGTVVPGPAIGADGTIYAASNGGVLHAFGSDGAERWSFDGGSAYGSDLSTTPAITRDGTILWPGPGGLFALGPDGDLLWKRDFDSAVLSPLLGDRDGRLYVMDMGGTLSALRVDPGGARELWSTELGSVSYSSPALGADGTVYAAADSSLFAVEPGAGDVSWELETGDLIEVSPAVAPDGTVVTGSNDATVRGVAPDGSESWRRDLGEITYSSPAASANGVVYIGDHSGAVSAFDAADGSEVGRYAGQPRTEQEQSVGVWTAPLVDGRGRVYFGSRLGHVYGFSAGGRELFGVSLAMEQQRGGSVSGSSRCSEVLGYSLGGGRDQRRRVEGCGLRQHRDVAV